MAKKDAKAKAADKKARVAAKQNKKAAQKEKKGKTKVNADDSEVEDVDLEAVLEEYARQQAQFLKVTEVSCEPPPPRSSSTLIGSPTNDNELFLFGGELFNGALATFYNDLFVYLIHRGEWRKVTSPNTPLPRSGHAWCRGGNAGGIYLFGGEFSSPKQGTFYHYNDFWRLDPVNREWTRIESKKGPPARSGHRMVFFKNYIILFGGFQDTSQQTKYLQDLWVYDTQNYLWYNPPLPPASQKPDARSSFSFLPHESGAVLYGGYSRVKTTAVACKQTKGGGGQATRTVLQPMVHQDSWFLRITQPVSEGSPTVRWERRKKPTNAPNPPRAGATMAYHRFRGIAFGGVHDVEKTEEGIDSEFFDTLHAWNVDRNRFFPLTLRKPRGPSRTQQARAQAERGGERRGRGKADEEELLRNLAALETKGSINDAADMEIEVTKEEEEQKPLEQPILNTMPHARFNAQMAVQDDILYIYGGTYENGDREYTFDEMYAIDLSKLDGVKQIFYREVENWDASEEEDSDEEAEEDSDGDEDENMSDGDSSTHPILHDDMESAATAVEDNVSDGGQTVIEEEVEANGPDTRPYPRPFESLREFFTRTSITWQEILIADFAQTGSSDVNTGGGSVKEMRKLAFAMAERRWWDVREEIMALEDQQEEAGIGEVVNITDRGEGAGLGKRR